MVWKKLLPTNPLIPALPQKAQIVAQIAEAQQGEVFRGQYSW